MSKKASEPYPARTPFLRFLDRLMLAVAFLAPVALIPQVLRVYAGGNVHGLSLYTWSAVAVANSLWALYGFAHKDKIILIANVLIAILNFSIACGIVLYS